MGRPIGQAECAVQRIERQRTIRQSAEQIEMSDRGRENLRAVETAAVFENRCRIELGSGESVRARRSFNCLIGLIESTRETARVRRYQTVLLKSLSSVP